MTAKSKETLKTQWFVMHQLSGIEGIREGKKTGKKRTNTKQKVEQK